MRPSYARSSEMYTHMGTMPRFPKKKDKSNKTKSQEHKSLKIKNKTKGSPLSRSQSMRCSDYVIDSPLLGALNAKALSSLHENSVDDKLPAEPQKEPEAVSTREIHKDPDNTRSKPVADPHPPPDALQEKPGLPRKSSLAVKISRELQKDDMSTVSEGRREKEEEEERKTRPESER